MTDAERSALIRRNRPRGLHIPTHDVSAYLANGWKVLDECIGYDEVLLLPSVRREERCA